MNIRFVIANLQFSTTKRLVVIRRVDRKDLPHLTISFQNSSCEIDLHLNYENARSSDERYVPLTRFSWGSVEQSLEGFLLRFETEFRRLFLKVPTVTSVWLIRRGYVIALMHGDNIQSAILATAPKLRGKHRIDADAVKKLFENVDPSLITLLDPSALSSTEVQNHPSVFAARARGRNRLISLRYVPMSNGVNAWARIDPIADEMARFVVDAFPAEITEAAKDVWRKIYDAMQLAEVGLARN